MSHTNAPDKFRVSKSIVTMSFSVTPELYAQVLAWNRGLAPQSHDLREIMVEYLSFPAPPNPITPEVIAHVRKLNPPFARTRQFNFNIPVSTYPRLRGQLEERAAEENLTISAIMRRAVYEITRPHEPNMTATFDGWGDAKKR
jgi:hypothetical protein